VWFLDVVDSLGVLFGVDGCCFGVFGDYWLVGWLGG